MGKFNEYTQKATPADNDTLMIYDAAAKANKLSPFSGIWNWIVGKLTNAVISNLQTSNQTVIGAINELGGNSHLGTLNDNIAEYLRKTKKLLLHTLSGVTLAVCIHHGLGVLCYVAMIILQILSESLTVIKQRLLPITKTELGKKFLLNHFQI